MVLYPEPGRNTKIAMEMLQNIFKFASHGVAIVGALVVLWGVLLVIWNLFQSECARCKGEDVMRPRELLRHQLGFYLLLGLEILIAADVLKTILEPTLDELITLGAIVLIRTVVSLTLNWEINQSEQRAREQ